MARMLARIILLTLIFTSTGSALEAGRISHRVSLDPSSVSIGRLEDGRRSVTIEGAAYTNYTGLPRLPYIIVSILLPQGEDVVSLALEGAVSRRIEGDAPIALFEGDYLDDGTARGVIADRSEVISDDSIFPAWRVRHLGTESYRGYAIASIAVYPVRYGMKTGSLTLETGMELVVETSMSASRGQRAGRRRLVEGFRERTESEVRSLVVNPGMASSYSFADIEVDGGDRGFAPSYLPSMEGSEVAYLIVTSEEMAPYFQQLADWKTMKGVPAVVRTIEWIESNYRHGADLGETIRNFIAEAYEKWGVEYVLLGGDSDIIPARFGYVSFYTGDFIPTDMYYSCLDGNWNDDGDAIWGEAYHSASDPGDYVDLYAEVYLGRMPVSTGGEAEVLIGKTMAYELPEEFPSKRKYVLMGEVIFPTIWEAGEPVTMDGAVILEGIHDLYLASDPDVDARRLYQTFYDFPGSIYLDKASAVDSMNAGANHVIHAGHGSKYNMSVGVGSILNYDADNLVNGGRTFSMYLLNCTNVAFDTDCLAEYFLLNSGGGAFAVTGASRSAFPSASLPYMDAYYDLLFTKDVVQLGRLYTKSREPFTPGAVAETADRWTHFIYNYLGDPELCMYRGEVDTFEVLCQPTADFGPNDITVTVSSGGAPFDSAWVCLYKEDDDYAYGYTDELGAVTFEDFLCRDGGIIHLTVTGIDHARFSDTISVNQEPSAFLRVERVRVNDYIVGNEDQVLDSGESVAFSVKLENTGEAGADRIYAVIRSGDPDVTITDSISVYPPISQNWSSYPSDPFYFSVASTVEDEDVIEFTLDIHDSTGGFWSEDLAVVVHAPEIELYFNTVSDDPPYGDGDGTVTSGEQFLLRVGVKNFGTGTATGLEGVVRSRSAALAVVDSTSVYPDLGLLDTGFGEGFVISEADLASANHFEFELTDGFGRSLSRRMELRRPGAPDSMILDSTFGPTEIHMTWSAPDDLERYRYLAYHSKSPGGPYEQASDDLLDHDLYRDRGLDPSTRYYFVVTAVDSCGNMSGYSDEGTSTTSPPQLKGWPNTVSKESSSSPRVGDIDGDTHLDLVIGSEYVHAWHSDGVELRDGDSQPLTWGIFNTEGTTFTATVALGPLDGNPGLEIVGAAWDTRRVYVFDADGGVLPGFPKTTVDLCWASPVLGDLDGDGDLEIIAYDVDGTVYVWHHDGTELIDGDSDPSTDGPFFSAGLSSDGWHVSTPAVADMDGDGDGELIVCAPSDYIYCLESDGSAVPGWPVAVDAGANISASPAVGDIDGDGHPEVIVQNSFARVYGLNHDGTEMSGWPKWVTSNSFFNSSPALGDLTGDGLLEVVLAGQDGYVHIFRADGSSLSGWPVLYSGSGGTESSPTIADITGDGSLDILIGAEDGFLHAWDIGGNDIAGFPIQLNGYLRGTPVVEDFDLDGDVEVITSCWDRKVYIFDIDAAIYHGYQAWNGFRGNLLNNGWVEQADLTGSVEIACAWTLAGGRLVLSWTVPAGIASWEIHRSSGDDGFELLAGELRPDEAGMVVFADPLVEEGLSYSYRLQAAGDGSMAAETGGIEIPVSSVRLYQNYPNPFNPATRLAFTVPGGSSTATNVLLTIYDVRGALVRTLVNGPVEGGRHLITWDGTNDRGEPVSSGVYFSRLAARGEKKVKKMLLLR